MKIKMHKIIALLMLVFMLVLASQVSAASLTGASNVQVGETFTLTLNFGQNVGAYDSINVSYNPSIIEYVSGDSLNESIWYDESDESYGIGSKSYTFRAIAAGSDSVEVIAKGVNAADEAITPLGDITVTKNISVSGAPQEQPKPTQTQNSNGNVKQNSTYSSGNNYLKLLQISEEGMSPYFNRNTVDYALTVGENVSNIEVLALADDSNARVEITGNTNIVEGDNKINIRVTAENGYYRIYTITVTKAKDVSKANAFLENLIVEGFDFSKEFQSETLEYDLGEIPFGTESFNIAAIAKDQNAKVEIIGAEKLVESGEGEVIVKVTAPDGNTTKEYKVKYIIKAGTEDEISDKQMQDYLKDIQESKSKKGVFVAYLKYILAAIKKNYLLAIMYVVILVQFIVILILAHKLKKAKDYTGGEPEDKTILKIEKQEEKEEIPEQIHHSIKIEPPKVELLKEDNDVPQETTAVELPKLGRAGSRAEAIEEDVKTEIEASSKTSTQTPGKIQLVDLDKNEGPQDELTFNIFENLNDEDIKRMLDEQIDKD